MKVLIRPLLVYLAPWLAAAGLVGLGCWLAEAAVPRLIHQAYAERSLPVLNRIIKDRTRPVEFYLQEWHERRKGFFRAALMAAGLWAAGAANLALWLRNRRKHWGRLHRQELDRAILLMVLATAGGLFFLLCYPLLAGHVYLYDDLGYLHLPLRSYYSRSLQQGRLPAWCPELFCGFDAHGEGQGGFLHPVKLLLYGLLPLEAAFNVDTVLAYPAAFAGMWFFLRRRRLQHGSAALGGLTYAFSAYLALRLNHTNVIQILAHLPWLLGCVDILIVSARPRSRRLAGAAVAALTASQLLLGYPPSVWYSGLTELAYAMLIGWGRRLPGRLLQFAAAKLLGLLVAAGQLLPTLAQIPLSQRAKLSWQGLAMDSLIPWNFFQWISPFAFSERTVGPARPWEFAQYAGLLAPAAIGWLLIQWRAARNGFSRRRAEGQNGWGLPARDRRLLAWAVVMVLLGAVFALGAYGPVFWLLATLPPFRFFRSWARYSLWIFVGLSVGVALAVQGLLRQAGRREKIRTAAHVGAEAGLPQAAHWLLAMEVLLAAMPMVLARLEWRLHCGVPWGTTPGLLFGPVGLLVVWWLLGRSAKGKSWALLGLVMFHLADLACYDLSYWLTRCRFDRLDHFIASIDLPPDQKGMNIPSAGCSAQELPRVWTQPAQEANVCLLVGRRSAGGWWGGLVPRQSLPYPHPNALRVAGVAWWKKGPFEPEPWQAVPNPLPEVRLAAEAVVSQDPAKDLERIDPARTVLLDRPVGNGSKPAASPVIPAQAGIQNSPIPAAGEGGLRSRRREGAFSVIPAQAAVQTPLCYPLVPPHPASLSAPPASPAVGEANILERRPGFFRIQIETPTQQFLVAAETWHPGWQAQVDGRPAEILRAYGDFMAVGVEPGKHEVVLEWAPGSLRWGLIGTGVGLAGLALWIGLAWRSGFSRFVASAAAKPAPSAPPPPPSAARRPVQESPAGGR